MTCEITDVSNLHAVNGFRESIVDVIPKVCDAADDLDHNLAEELCDQLYDYPKQMHTFTSYQMEKIFCYLGDNPSPHAKTEAIYAPQQAQHFAEGFAKSG